MEDQNEKSFAEKLWFKTKAHMITFHELLEKRYVGRQSIMPMDELFSEFRPSCARQMILITPTEN
jgi:hypothetical protein